MKPGKATPTKHVLSPKGIRQLLNKVKQPHKTTRPRKQREQKKKKCHNRSTALKESKVNMLMLIKHDIMDTHLP